MENTLPLALFNPMDVNILERAPMNIPLESRLQGEVAHPYRCLVQGMVFPNYRVLCDALMEQVRSGKSRELQFKKWEVYFSWKKSGNKFIIKNVRKSPLEWELIDRLTMRHVYKVLLISALYPLLAVSPSRDKSPGLPGTVLGVELRKIFYWLGVVNEKGCEKFIQRKYGTVEKEFFTVLKAKNYAALISVIEELRHGHYLVTDHRYKVQIEGQGVPKITNASETAAIDSCIRKILDGFSCETMQDVFLKKLSEKFYYEVQKNLLEEFGIRFFEKCFNFAGVPENLYNYFYSLEGAQVSLEALFFHCQSQSATRMKLHAENKWKVFLKNEKTFHAEGHKNVDLPESYLNQIQCLIQRYIETIDLKEQEILQEKRIEFLSEVIH